MPSRKSDWQGTRNDAIWITRMPCAEAIAEKTALFDDMCRRLHRVVLEPCDLLFRRSRAAPGKEEVLDNIDGAED